MPDGLFVSYLRVSTRHQGRSGLGLEAQRTAVTDFLNGGNWRLAAEFVEVESGKRDDRPELAKALSMCRAMGAKLVVAKIDRLARNVFFISGLMRSGVDFVAADMPNLNALTVHVLAAVAEQEAVAVSARTKAALAAAKARGVQLGGRRRRIVRDAAGAATSERGEVVMTLDDGVRSLAVASRQRKAASRAADLAAIIRGVQADITHEKCRPPGMRELARELSKRGVPTPNGGMAWQPVQISRVLARAGTNKPA